MRRWLQLAAVLLLACHSAFACTATEENKGASTFTSGTSPSFSLTINSVGDLVAIGAWCQESSTVCTFSSVKLGSQTATCLSTAIDDGASNTGVGYICYVLSASASGSQTVSGTASSGTTDSQLWAIDINMGGCTATEGTPSSLATGSGTSATTPSFTPTTGSIVYDYTAVQNATTITCGSPYTKGTQGASSQNTDEYVLSSSGTVTNNMSLSPTGDWASLAVPFTMAASSTCTPTLGILGTGCQ